MSRSAVSDVCNDLDALVPSFRARVETLLERMRAKGWRPIVFETRRTKERAAELFKRGTGSLDSMHCYDVAVDIVDADLNNVPRKTKEGYWDAPAEFWADLEDFAHDLGLHRLYKRGVIRDADDEIAQSWDKPHVQACSVADQTKTRALDREARDIFVSARMDAAAKGAEPQKLRTVSVDMITLPVLDVQGYANARGIVLDQDGDYGPRTVKAWIETARLVGADPVIQRVGARTARVAKDTLRALGVRVA